MATRPKRTEAAAAPVVAGDAVPAAAVPERPVSEVRESAGPDTSSQNSSGDNLADGVWIKGSIDRTAVLKWVFERNQSFARVMAEAFPAS